MQTKRYIGYALAAIGFALILLGVREVADSQLGQTTAARDFNSRAAETVPSASAQRPKRSPRVKLGETIARLYIPRLKRDLYVVEGDDDAELRLGPGHIPGTAMPGAKGNAVIAGHRDTHFRSLGQMRRGDEVIVQTHAGKFAYRVTGTSIVLPSDVSSLQPAKSAMLHLVTCYPFYWAGPAPKRFVVEARLAKRIS